ASLEAAPRKSSGGAGLAAPVDRLALIVLDVNIKIRMGIGPFDFRECAPQADGLAAIELRRKRVMRPQLHCGHQSHSDSQDSMSDPHGHSSVPAYLRPIENIL